MGALLKIYTCIFVQFLSNFSCGKTVWMRLKASPALKGLIINCIFPSGCRLSPSMKNRGYRLYHTMAATVPVPARWVPPVRISFRGGWRTTEDAESRYGMVEKMTWSSRPAICKLVSTWDHNNLQRQTAVTAHLQSKQLLLFIFSTTALLYYVKPLHLYHGCDGI